jgi:hypothetical protein
VIDVTSRVRNVEIKVLESSSSYALDASHRNNHLVPLQHRLLTHNGKGFPQPTPTTSSVFVALWGLFVVAAVASTAVEPGVISFLE